MNTLQKRFLLFLVGCMGTRSLFVYASKNACTTVLKYMGYLALIPAIGFLYIYISDTRKTGPEVFGREIWWNDLRPLHGILYLMFAYNAVNGNKCAWIFLLVDIFPGLIGFLIYHAKNSDLSLLCE